MKQIYFVQIWAFPAIVKKGWRIETDDRLSIIKNVTVKHPAGKEAECTFVQTKFTGEEINQALQEGTLIIQKILARLSFMRLDGFDIFSTRVVEDKPRGGRVKCIVFPGPPSFLSDKEFKIGFEKEIKLDFNYIDKEVSIDTERAINWLIKGISAQNSLEQVIYWWTGLETLAPEVKGSWHCTKCDSDVKTCPVCEFETEGPRTVVTIKNYLINNIGITKSEFNLLYRFRCGVIHGNVNMDITGITTASKHAMWIHKLLLDGIKINLGIPRTDPPIVSDEGYSMQGSPGLILEEKIEKEDYYEQPSVYPEGFLGITGSKHRIVISTKQN